MPAPEQLPSGLITWLMFLLWQFLPGHLSCWVTDFCQAQDLVVLPALLCYKIGTQQLPACNGKHTLLAFSVARCFFTFLVPQVFCGCELTYSDTRNSEFRGSLWTSGEAGLLWGLGGGTSSLSSLLRSQCLVSPHWEGAWVGGQNRSGWCEDNRVSPKTGRNLRTTTA